MPDLSSLKKSILEICPLLKSQDLIILRSTVPVGCTRNLVINLIEKKQSLNLVKIYLFHLSGKNSRRASN